jgi:hypothetical protein
VSAAGKHLDHILWRRHIGAADVHVDDVNPLYSQFTNALVEQGKWIGRELA